MITAKQPAVFVAHGGGPLPILNHSSHRGLTRWLQQFSSHLTSNPVSILVISAHWEVRSYTRHDGGIDNAQIFSPGRTAYCGNMYLQDKQPTLTSAEAPGLIYDYYNFPPESYEITYPAPGSPTLAQHAADLLR
jgi:aromatic ring-opening dioxygenase catalytic subunit (LigB family)